MKAGNAVGLNDNTDGFLPDSIKAGGTIPRSASFKMLHFRITELLIISQIIYFSWKWGFYLLKISSIIYPVGLANYLDISFLLHYPNSLINAGIITMLILSGFLRLYKYNYAIALIFVHLQYAARFSEGKIGHGSVLPGLMFLSVALAIIFFSIETDRASVAMFLMLFFAGLAYDSAALSKLIASGLSWAQGDHLWMWMQENFIDQLSADGNLRISYLQHLVLGNQYLATAALGLGILTEISGLFLLKSKVRPYIATALIGMHFGIFLLLKIDFSSYILILLVIGYPWDRWIEKGVRFMVR